MPRLSAVLFVAAVMAVIGARPPAASAPAPPTTSCVACHTSAAALQPLVRPLPPAPAEGEG